MTAVHDSAELCLSCGDKMVLDNRRGEVYCQLCGLVVQSTVLSDDPVVDENGELQGYGPAMLIDRGSSLATKLTADRRDGRGNRIPDVARQRLAKLSKLDGHSIPRENRVTRKLFALVSQLTTSLELGPEFRDRAFYIVKQAYRKRILSGQEFSVLVASSVFLACREYGRFVDIRTVTKLAEVHRGRPVQQVMRGYVRIKRALGIKVKRKSAFDMLSAIASKLGLTREEQRAIVEILKSHRPSMKPEADLAAAIYIAIKGRLSQKMIAGFGCGTSEVSLRARLRATFK